nr:hypothetical protein [Tanacetum cinerariifolium]
MWKVKKQKLLRNQKSRMCLLSKVEEEKVRCVQVKMKLMFQSYTSDESAYETNDADESNLDLTDNNPAKDDDAAGYETLLDETSVNELTDLMSHPIYTDTHTTSVVHNPKGNPKAKKNMKKINFKKAVTQKFRDYDQKLEALTNFNISEAFEKAVQARVLTEIKKLLLTHIPKAIENYVRPRLNTTVLKVMKNNHVSLFTKSSTSVDELSDTELKLKLLNKTRENKTRPINQKLYDSILLD